MDSRDLEILILILISHDPNMESRDLVEKVAIARNSTKESGRVYDWPFGLSEEIGRVKKDMRNRGLITYGRGRQNPHHLRQRGRELIERFRGELEIF